MDVSSVSNIITPLGVAGQVEVERTSGSASGAPVVAVTDEGQEGKGGKASDVKTVELPSEAVSTPEPKDSAGWQTLPTLASCLTTNSGGGGAVLPSLVRYVTSARSPTPRLDEKGARRVGRFYQRYFTGVGVGGQLRFLTLTSSDYAVAQGYDIHRHYRALVMRLRRRFGRFEYMGVVERKGDREHLHLVFRGEYMAQALISAIWQELHASPVVDIRAVWGSRGGAAELAKYLVKAVKNHYWASYGWVFQGWVGWSKAVKRCIGAYPSKACLTRLAQLGGVTASLATHLVVGWYPWLEGRLALAIDK